ncbi:MAG: SDR family oxidoreductase [Oscillospiraceae bacterium]|nr:SDR family oxidoreductase [Oscillospiraceae bacterium]
MSVIKTPPITSMEGAFSVKGLNVVVTGGNRGIGFGIATAFAQGGANVAILCRNIESGRAAAEKLSCYGGKIYAFKVDISDMDSIKAAKAEVEKVFDTLDVLVNNAGISATIRYLEDEDMKVYNEVSAVDFFGPAYMINQFTPMIIKGGKGGSIINISSIGGQSVSGTKTNPNIAYHACKAALDNLTRSLAIEFGDYGIRVNAIAPGPTHSDLDALLPPDAFEKVESRMPLHRFGEPIEIGALSVFLASPAGCQITGVIIVHDGGLICVG